MKNDLELYRCKNCGWVCDATKVGSIGTAHAHAEKHAKLGGFLPAWIAPSANPKQLDKFIQRISVTDYEELETEFESEEDYEF